MTTATGTTVLNFASLADVDPYINNDFSVAKTGASARIVSGEIKPNSGNPDNNYFLIYNGLSNQTTLSAELELNHPSSEWNDPVGIAFLNAAGDGYIVRVNGGEIALKNVTAYVPQASGSINSTTNNTYAAGDVIKLERNTSTGLTKFYLNATELGSVTNTTVSGALKPALFLRRDSTGRHGVKSFAFTGAAINTVASPTITAITNPLKFSSNVTVTGTNLSNATRLRYSDGTRNFDITAFTINTATALTHAGFNFLSSNLRLGDLIATVTTAGGDATFNIAAANISAVTLNANNVAKQTVLTSYNAAASNALKPAAGQPILASGQAILYGAKAYTDAALTTLSDVDVTITESGQYELSANAAANTEYFIAHYRQIGTSVWSALSVAVVQHNVVLAPTLQSNIAGQNVNEGVQISIDVSAHFSANATSFSLNSVAANAGLAINSSGVLSGSIATTQTLSGIVVTAANSAGSVDSNAFDLVVNAVVVAPQITTQPVAITLNESESLSLVVVASGSNLSYQWEKDGNSIAGATASTYQKTADLQDAGTYAVTVSNSAGSVTSSAVVVAVNAVVVAQERPKAYFAWDALYLKNSLVSASQDINEKRRYLLNLDALTNEAGSSVLNVAWTSSYDSIALSEIRSTGRYSSALVETLNGSGGIVNIAITLESGERIVELLSISALEYIFCGER